MQNQEWSFNDILFFSSHNSVPVYNHGGETIGLLERADAKSIDVNTDHMRTGDAYRFKDTDGRTRMAMGVKKGKMHRRLRYHYMFQPCSEEEEIELRDQIFFPYFRFHVKGRINDEQLEIYQNRHEQLIVRCEKVTVATITFKNSGWKVSAYVHKIQDSCVTTPEFLTLAYCMFRLNDFESSDIKTL